MKSVSVLDCTLRDGGFINQWMFGDSCIYGILKRLDDAGIDIIELGYLRDKVQNDVNKTEFSGTAAIKPQIINQVKNAKLVAMIDYGDCSLEAVEEKKNTILDGIRVTFKKKKRAEALAFCKEIKKKGYAVFVQPVSITDYAPEDVIKLCGDINELEPFAVSIVDTYGFMDIHWLLRYFYLFDTALMPSIRLGYHAHNNLQLANANATKLVEHFSKRKLIIDSSVFGMGKGAGNANTELISLYLNENESEKYHVDSLLEIIDLYIDKLRGDSKWGYSLKHYMAAANRCHYKYIEYLLRKKTFSIREINEIILHIAPEKKTQFDEQHMITLCRNYKKRKIDDCASRETLKNLIAGRNILVLGSGNSVFAEKKKIVEYIQKERPVVIAVNYLPRHQKVDAVFVNNAVRYEEMEYELVRAKREEICFFVTSNIKTAEDKQVWAFDYEKVIFDNSIVGDNSGIVLLHLLCQEQVDEVVLAGFDGFEQGKENYYEERMDFANVDCAYNEEMKHVLKKIGETMKLSFLTESGYNS